jgi:GNAT superfamily N-acetyltransferase
MNLGGQMAIRRMSEADIPQADELRRLAGWPPVPGKWRGMLQLEPQGCFLAVKGEQVAGTVTAISYGQELAWVGMLLVRPDFRRKGIGRRLMEHAVEYARGVGIRCIRLDATPAGLPLYQKIGFATEWTMTRWQGANVAGQNPESAAPGLRKLGHADLRAVREIDRHAFGAPRLDVLNRFARESIEALVWQPQDKVEGFGLLRPSADSDYLGPLICSSTEGFKALARALVAKAQKPLVHCDVPDKNEAAGEFMKEAGFKPVGTLARMRLGPNLVKSDPLAQYAIADPAVG